jgi:hypothetical protein
MFPPDHSAAGPAAGFEQQRQLALVLLCESYAGDPSVRVRLEAVEDIDVVSDLVSIDSRVQVKHHLADHTLTDLTPELLTLVAVSRCSVFRFSRARASLASQELRSSPSVMQPLGR